MCLIGAVDFAPSEYHGRFKITTNQYHAFVIDSATGQVWSQYFSDEPSTLIGAQPDEFHTPKLLIGSHAIEGDDF
jgi:hypothetical protein